MGETGAGELTNDLCEFFRAGLAHPAAA